MNSPILNNLTPATLRTNSTPAAVRGWAVGQIINATVLAVDAEHASATLLVGDQRMQARINVPVLAGQQLTLRLASSGSLPVLERLDTDPEPGGGQPAGSESMTTPQALRTRLPQALPLNDVLTTLTRSADAKGSDAAQAATPRLQATMQSLIAALPTLEELGDPPSLKRAMQGSGLFLEALLANGSDKALQAALPRDFKAQLMRLANELPQRPAAPTAEARVAAANGNPSPVDDPTLPGAERTTLTATRAAATTLAAQQALEGEGEPAPRLGDQLRGGVAQIEVNQLRHLSDSAQGNAVWRIDLPVRDANGDAQLLHLQIEEEPPARQEGETVQQWTMRVDLDIQPLGPMHAKVTLIGERVHTVIWAEREHTLALLQGNVDWLQSQLARAGLDASDVQCLAGRPVVNANAITDAPLVDLTV